MAGYPKILHTEEGMRDGLQIENRNISVEDKIRLIDALSEAQEKPIDALVEARFERLMAHGKFKETAVR